MTLKVLLDSRGNHVSLGGLLGRGGEGSVYEVSGRTDLVAKLYHGPIDAVHADKLRAMVAARDAQLAQLTTWPVEVLFGSDKRLSGILIPRVQDIREIHLLYGPKSRMQKFSDVTWAFLIRAAANVARAFAVIHSHGHVIGDVNHGNIVVGDDATVKLIDCDSFQISANGRLFRCAVGISTHTPPELQGKSFRLLDRNPNHDAFGLAVLIFQLLFMGRHPFAGTSRHGDKTLEEAITEYRFAYGSGAVARGVDQPPYTLPLEAVSAPVASLFESAFESTGCRSNGRPTAVQWVSTLSTLEKSLSKCVANGAHLYYRGLNACPWCGLEANTNVTLFHLKIRAVTLGCTSVDVLWAQIQAVPHLGMAIPFSYSSPSQPQSEYVKAKASCEAASNIGCLVWIIGIIVSIFGGQLVGVSVAFPAIVATVILTSLIYSAGSFEKVKAKASDELKSADIRWSEASRRWSLVESSREFDIKLRELRDARDRYTSLPSVRIQRIDSLQRPQRQRQLQTYLDAFRIEDARIPGVGPARLTTLESFGIETAGDVEARRILRLPKFGPKITTTLVDWRRRLEGKFVFNPVAPCDPRDLQRIDSELQKEEQRLLAILRGGATELQNISARLRQQRELIRPELEKAAASRAQAQANLDVFK